MAASKESADRNLFDTFNSWRGSGETPDAVLAALGEMTLVGQVDIIGLRAGVLWDAARGKDIADIFVKASSRSCSPDHTVQLLGGTVADVFDADSIWIAEARPSQLRSTAEAADKLRYWRFALEDVVYLANAGWPTDPRSEVMPVENSIHRRPTHWEQMQREMNYNELVYGNPFGRTGRASADMGGPM